MASDELQQDGISVIMPAFNLAPYLETSARSVLAQTWSNLELLIIDDCSSDDTGMVAQRLAEEDHRVRVLKTPRNLGGAGARNLGIAEARAPYVAFLDGDDLWAPEKLARQREHMSATGATLSYTAVQKIDAGGRRIGQVQTVPDGIGYEQLLGNPIIGCSTVLLNHAALGHPLMPEIRKRQDFAFWLKLLREGAVARGVNEPLTLYRVRPGSLSANKLNAALYTWRVYREHEKLSLLRTLPKFISYAWRGYRKARNR